MERLRATVAVPGTSEEAHELLAAYFSAERSQIEPIQMLLDIPVDVTATPGRDDENLNDLWRISWTSSAGGPFPRFTGTLFVCADEHGESYLELDGTYEPPLGVVFGAAFQAVAGRQVAQRTAQLFLDRVAAGMRALRAIRS